MPELSFSEGNAGEQISGPDVLNCWSATANAEIPGYRRSDHRCHRSIYLMGGFRQYPTPPLGKRRKLVSERENRLRKDASEQESVRPPGFIGFPGFRADGLPRSYGPGSESSPMFTDLSAHCCIDRGRRRKPSFRLRRRPPRSGTSGMCKRRQEAPRASSIGWCDDPHGALREGQTAPKVPSNKGLHLPSAPDTIREFQYSRLSENALLSVGSCLRSAFRTVILKPTVPGRAKHSSLRQLAVSSNSRAEPGQ